MLSRFISFASSTAKIIMWVLYYIILFIPRLMIIYFFNSLILIVLLPSKIFEVIQELFKKIRICFYNRKKLPRLNPIDYIYYKRNSRRFINIFSALIDKYEKEAQEEYFILSDSCKKDMVSLMKSRLSIARVEVASWKDFDTDYIKIAHAHLSIVSFDLLSSGKFHLSYGCLSPFGPARNLKRIHSRAVRWALENNYITQEDVEEDSRALAQAISNVG